MDYATRLEIQTQNSQPSGVDWHENFELHLMYGNTRKEMFTKRKEH